MKKRIDTALRVAGFLLLTAVIYFYNAFHSIMVIPTVALSFILMLGSHATQESARLSDKKRGKVIRSASAGIKWSQSPILWMIVLIAFGGVLSLFL